MTIIAYAGGQIACDSLAVCGDRKSYVKKFRVLDNGNILFVAGEFRQMAKAARLLNKGQPLTQSIVCAATLVLYNPIDGACSVYDETAEPEAVTGGATWGTGQDLGIGALEAGADVVRACEIACKYSNSCGGRIHLFKPE
jgi:hypothetical protein